MNVVRGFGLVLALLLIPAFAHAEGGRPREDARLGAMGCGAKAGGCGVHGSPTRLRIVPPKNAAVLVDDGSSLISQVSTTATVLVPSGRSYGITATRGAKVLWSAKVAANGGRLDIVWSHGPVPVIRHAAPAPLPPPVPVPILPSPMAGSSFKALVALVDAESFETGKMSLVKTASAQNYFTVAQVGRILDEFDFESTRLQALEALRSRILDPENGFLVAKHFTFLSNQQKAVAMFSP